MRRSWAPAIVIALAAAGSGCSFGGLDPAAPDGELSDDDPDHDGVDDPDDNCPTQANPGQGDEDDDQIGDECDLCPTIAGQDTDSDGDEVGDSCDPNPGTPGDALVMFDGFNGTAFADGWTAADGAFEDWRVNAGQAIADVGNSAASVLLHAVGAPGDKLRVDVAVFVDSIGDGAMQSFAVVSDATPAPLAFDFCSIAFDTQALWVGRYDSPVWTYNAGQSLSANVGSYQVRARTTAGPACTSQGIELPTSAELGNGGYIGFRVRNATVRFSYIAAYRSP